MVRRAFELYVSISGMGQTASLKKIFFPILLLPALAFGQAVLEEDCGNPYDSGGVGPYDINDKTIPDKIGIVVDHHFTRWMEEMAINGSTTRRATIGEEKESMLGGNLDYTLRAIPNHARALNAMAMWQLRVRRESMTNFRKIQSAGNFRTAECYFERAIMFKTDDGMVRMAYAVFLHRQSMTEAALDNYKEAIRLMPEAPEPHYNIGLLYIELEQFDLARDHAVRAYDLGFPLPGLRNALVRIGKWQDAGPDAAVQ